MLLFLLITSVLAARLQQKGGNLVLNGDFARTSIGLSWRTLSEEEVAPWQTNRVEVGVSTFYNAKWRSESLVAMLYPGAGNSLSQRIMCEGVPHLLRFEWAFSANNVLAIKANVKWNGIVVRQLTHDDDEIHSEAITLPALAGENLLEFSAQGTYSFELLHRAVSLGNITLFPK